MPALVQRSEEHGLPVPDRVGDSRLTVQWDAAPAGRHGLREASVRDDLQLVWLPRSTTARNADRTSYMRETASTAATPTSALVVDRASAEESAGRMAIRSASSLALRSARRGWSSMIVPTATEARYTSRSVALWASTSSVPVGGTNQYRGASR